MDKVLVIPSIRKDCIERFFANWQECGDWDRVILVEDNPEKTFFVNVDEHYSWKEINEILGDKSWIISRRDSAIRCFGFYMASKTDANYVLTLDDDCYPDGEFPIFAHHINKIENQRKWTESVPGMRTRGLPYQSLGEMHNVIANMGLWSNIPDFDAIQSLNNLELAIGGGFEPPKGNRIVPNGQYTAICGMNLCFNAQYACLFYFPLMGQGQPYKRFDDIWMGIILKKIIDHLRLCISIGEPFVEHQKASNVFDNLIKEAPGVKMNEDFWWIIDEIELTASSPLDCMKQIGLGLQNQKDEYLNRLGSAIGVWCSLF